MAAANLCTSLPDRWVAGGNGPAPERWAVADISYVREQYPTRTAQQIADDLNLPIGRVQRLAQYLKLRKRNASNKKALAVQPGDSVQIVQKHATGVQNDESEGCMVAGRKTRHSAFMPPVDLQGFLQHNTTTQVARALKISRTSAHRLRHGYWPFDARSLLAAWDTYCGRSASQTSGWFLRRVHEGDVVLHAGLRWAAPGLAGRTGQQLAVARSSGGLLAQTLELPSARFELVPAHAQA